MVSVALVITLAAVLTSLWMRRGTWRSRWEVGINTALALDGCALALMSPLAAAGTGPLLHRMTRLWAVQHLLGHLCLIVAAAGIVYHAMVRLGEPDQVRLLFARQIVAPVLLGTLTLVVLFVIADPGNYPDLLKVPAATHWLVTYWLVMEGLLIYLSAYGARLLLILRADPRARHTVNAYLAAGVLGATAYLAQVRAILSGADADVLVWWCGCLAVVVAAYAAARSWRSRVAWFTADHPAPPRRRARRDSNPQPSDP